MKILLNSEYEVCLVFALSSNTKQTAYQEFYAAIINYSFEEDFKIKGKESKFKWVFWKRITMIEIMHTFFPYPNKIQQTIALTLITLFTTSILKHFVSKSPKQIFLTSSIFKDFIKNSKLCRKQPSINYSFDFVS